MKFLYVLGNGSKFCDDEIKYSIRSVCKYTKTPEIMIVGNYLPKFLESDNLTFTKCADFCFEPQRNIIRKVRTFLQQTDDEGDFIYMNDDFFFNTFCNEFSSSHGGNLQRVLMNYPHNTGYPLVLRNTMNKLLGMKLPINDYDLHIPHKMNFEKLRYVFSLIEGDENINHRSIYGNIFEADDAVYREDAKLYAPSQLKDQDFFSVYDSFLQQDGINLLENLYPEKSIFEK